MRDLFANAARRYGDRPALRCGEQQRSYRDLIGRGARLANALSATGLRRGDRVAAMLEDRLESLEVHVAAALGGFVFVTVNHRFTAPEVAYLLEDSGARALVHTAGVSHVVDKVDCGSDLLVLTIGDGDRPHGALAYEDVLTRASTGLPDTVVETQDLSYIGYTSGTTGYPKGAMFTHAAQVRAVDVQCLNYRISMYGRLAFSASLSFVATLNSFLLPTLYTGGLVRFCGGVDAEEWVRAMSEDRSTLTYLPTPLMRPFIDAVRGRDDVLRHLGTIVHAASSAPRPLVEELFEAVGDRYIEAWGMTESQVALTSTTLTDRRGPCDADDPLGTIGRSVATSRVYAVSEDGAELPPGSEEEGELVAESDTLFHGYWNKPEATADALRDGGYRTGDIGRVDAAGYVYLTGGRRSDLIISGGLNVYPVEVELALAKHPDIAEAAVFGMPDDRWGETVAAAVVVRPGGRLDEEGVVSHVRQHLASYKKPTKVFFVEEMPKTVSLKIKKHDLRKQLGLDG